MPIISGRQPLCGVTHVMDRGHKALFVIEVFLVRLNRPKYKLRSWKRHFQVELSTVCLLLLERQNEVATYVFHLSVLAQSA
jgi:hypothetical protein